jgi:hypothetical protein
MRCVLSLSWDSSQWLDGRTALRPAAQTDLPHAHVPRNERGRKRDEALRHDAHATPLDDIVIAAASIN